MSRSGYTRCACALCPEIAISSDELTPERCNDCEAAGCDPARDCVVAEREAAHTVPLKRCGKCGAAIARPRTTREHEICPACMDAIPTTTADGTRRKVWFPGDATNGGDSTAADTLAMPLDASIEFFDPFARRCPRCDGKHATVACPPGGAS
jgi:hypothetical protein